MANSSRLGATTAVMVHLTDLGPERGFRLLGVERLPELSAR